MGTKLNIAAIILCKDSSETILNAIISAKSICKQVIVVDTGSTDNTPQIATKNGCELHFFQWCNDFSKARNYALKFVRTDWVLVLDSDEAINIESYLDFIKSTKIADKVGGIRVKIKNLLADDKTSTEHSYTRIFRANKKIKFKGKIHEQIADSIFECNLEIIDSDILIYHWGYSINKEERANRNRELLEEEIKENENDPWLKYHLAETEFSAGNSEKSKSIFEEIYNSQFLTQEQKETSKIRLGQIALKEENFEKINYYLDFKSSDTNKEGFRQFIIAISELIQGNFERTKDIIDKFIVRNSNLVPKEQLANIETLLKKMESN